MNWNDLTMAQKNELMQTYIRNGVTSLDAMRSHFNSFATGGPEDPPKKEPTPFEKALYNSINPTVDYPGAIGAMADYIYAKQKVRRGEEDVPEYKIGNTLGEQVAQAAWAKRLNMPYDEALLPVWNGDTVRLPADIEREIPIDTNFIKERIAKNKELQEKFPKKYKDNDYINAAIEEDENTLKALRKTYKTGKPVGISEMSWNSRQLLNNGEINDQQVSPLNVLHNYNIRYDKPTNRMYYSDEYDFNKYEKFVPGKPYRLRGYIDLNK